MIKREVPIWSLKVIGLVWLAVAGISGIFFLTAWLAGVPWLGWTAFALSAAALAVYSLVKRGLNGWGWIPIGLALALLWGVVRLIILALVSGTRHSRYGRFGGWD